MIDLHRCKRCGDDTSGGNKTKGDSELCKRCGKTERLHRGRGSRHVRERKK